MRQKRSAAVAASQVGDDVPHAVVREEEELAARLRKVVDAVARVQYLKRSSQLVFDYNGG